MGIKKFFKRLFQDPDEYELPENLKKKYENLLNTNIDNDELDLNEKFFRESLKREVRSIRLKTAQITNEVLKKIERLVRRGYFNIAFLGIILAPIGFSAYKFHTTEIEKIRYRFRKCAYG